MVCLWLTIGITGDQPMQTQAEQIVAAQQAAADRFVSGVSWSGLSPSRPTVETVEEVEARLQAISARALAFRRTPLGRFLTAVDELQAAGGYEDEALRLRGYYSRSMADGREPVDIHAVAACVRILAGINTSVARAGLEALADVMVERVAA
jgi:hypothetical protein